MSRFALVLVVAAAGVGTAVHRQHHHRTPTPAASAQMSSAFPLRVSRAQERQPLPGVKAPHPIRGQGASRPVSVRRARPAPGSGLHNWPAVAGCESGGRWHLNTGNGFYGGLQFLLSTWRSFGGRGRPDQASEAEQERIAERVLAVQGIRAWPHCGRYL